jgi:hypothetical protein
MAQREFYTDQVTEHVKFLLESQLGLEVVRDRWKDYEAGVDGHGSEVTVFSDLQEQLAVTPAVELIYKDSNFTQIAVGSQHEQLNYSIYVTINNTHPEHSKKYGNIIARSVVEILNIYENRRFSLGNENFYCVYDSHCENMQPGFRRGKGLFTVNISWWAKIMKPDKEF